jgi:large conductance mechanosensitive channel
MAKLIQEFKEFAVKGNVVDMAVGIIIGAAFGTIVKSLVSDVIMPPIGMLMGGVDFTDFFITLSGGSHDSLAAAKKAGAVTLNYGVFANTVISFLIVAMAVFILVKAINTLKRQQEEEEAKAPPAPPRQEVLLEEIRDALVKPSRSRK